MPVYASCALYMVSMKALGDAWEIIPPRLYWEAAIQWGLAQQLGLSLQGLVSPQGDSLIWEALYCQ